jgi:molybdenum cofactor cytidylyltransferase
MIDRLIDVFHESKDQSYISFSHNGIPKPPVLFTRILFPALEELAGDQGARALIRGEGKDQGKRMEVEDTTCFFDVDTQTDYQYVLENWQILWNRGCWIWR